MNNDNARAYRLGDLLIDEHETLIVTEMCENGEGCAMASGFYVSASRHWVWFVGHVETNSDSRVIR